MKLLAPSTAAVLLGLLAAACGPVPAPVPTPVPTATPAPTPTPTPTPVPTPTPMAFTVPQESAGTMEFTVLQTRVRTDRGIAPEAPGPGARYVSFRLTANGSAPIAPENVSLQIGTSIYTTAPITPESPAFSYTGPEHTGWVSFIVPDTATSGTLFVLLTSDIANQRGIAVSWPTAGGS